MCNLYSRAVKKSANSFGKSSQDFIETSRQKATPVDLEIHTLLPDHLRPHFFIVGLDRRLNLTEDIPRALLATESHLIKHEGETDALFLTITK